MGNRQKLSHHEELTRQPVTMKNQFTEKKLLRPFRKHLARKDDSAYRSELTRLNAEIDSGKKISLDQAKQLHETLKAEGL
jgi:hypothetical protein